MRRIIAIAVLSLTLISMSANAGPRDWLKHHRRFVIAAATLTAASIVQYKATSYCQQGDVERCMEGYGSRRAFNWFSVGLGGTMLAVSEACWKHDGPKPACYGMAYGVPAMQVGVGIHDFVNYRKED